MHGAPAAPRITPEQQTPSPHQASAVFNHRRNVLLIVRASAPAAAQTVRAQDAPAYATTRQRTGSAAPRLPARTVSFSARAIEIARGDRAMLTLSTGFMALGRARKD
jgi:hypothetical protein